ncbi:MAG TPA: hypothetical protein VMJ90_04515 [Anaerolineales bacterium]|nr:hypothetical protein [Anaerolineales bacterium]
MAELLNFKNCCVGYLVISTLVWMFSSYAYLDNRRREINDPEQKDYDLRAVFFAPFTWPFLLFGGAVFTIIKAVFFGVFLLVFSLAVAVIRKPFFWPLIEPIVSRIGRRLLKANTFLVRLFDRDP